MRVRLTVVTLAATLALPAADAPAQKNEGLGLLGPMGANRPNLLGGARHSRPTARASRRRAKDKEQPSTAVEPSKPPADPAAATPDTK